MMKRLYLSLIAVAAIAALTTVGSLALFTSEKRETTNTFTAGTVTLGVPDNRVIDLANMLPGDSYDKDYIVEYTGNVQAWLGIKWDVSGTLRTCEAGKLTVSVATDVTGGGSTSYTRGATDPQVVLNSTGVAAPLNPNETRTFRVHYALASDTSNACQGKSADLTITTRAVQYRNNIKTELGVEVGPNNWDWDAANP